ncbi:MAG: T9SS type A sorting domain-containing protein, partial [candidate division Zixibacteria bacterium]|nr:T9SS type A sorting domain-containing protein [candidate division Zixibacteria bacterium]
PATVTSIFDEIDDTSDDGWRFGRWNATANSYDAFPGLTSVSRNHGYWLITKGAYTITSDGVSSVPDDPQAARRFASIQLNPGWNQIASPFAFDVAVSMIEYDSGIEQALHEYVSSNGSYRTVSTLRPFRGYWIYNDGANSAAIRIPYEQSGGAVIADRDTDDANGESWVVSLAVGSGDRRDIDNRVGVRTDASDRYDACDRSEPPVIGRYVSLASDVKEDNGKSHPLTHDYRGVGNDVYAYDIVIRSNTGEPVTMTADLSEMPVRFRAVLVNPHGSETFDLMASRDVTLPSVGPQGEARYTLLVGTEQQLTAETNDTESVPRRFSLSQNYPNPFNAGTVISYTLTENEHVDLSIYDVLGRHITTLVSEAGKPGVHHVEWNGRDANGQSVASGVYFYRLNAGANSDVRKMMVVK